MPYLSSREFEPPEGLSAEEEAPIDAFERRRLGNALDVAPFQVISTGNVFDDQDDFGATIKSGPSKTQRLDVIKATTVRQWSGKPLRGVESPFDIKDRDPGTHFIFPSQVNTTLLQEQPPEPLKGPYTEVEIPAAPDTPEYDHPVILNLAVSINEYLRTHRTNRTIIMIIGLFMVICSGTALISTFGPRASEVQATTGPVPGSETATPSEPVFVVIPTASAPVLPPVSSLGNLQVSAPVPGQQTNAVTNSNRWDYYNPALNALIDVELNQAGYVVRPGDTLWAISLLTYCEEFVQLAAQNGIENPDLVEIGQTVVFDLDHQPTVQSGETIYDVAARCSVDPLELAAANGLTLDQPLVAGTRLNVPR